MRESPDCNRSGEASMTDIPKDDAQPQGRASTPGCPFHVDTGSARAAAGPVYRRPFGVG